MDRLLIVSSFTSETFYFQLAWDNLTKSSRVGSLWGVQRSEGKFIHVIPMAKKNHMQHRFLRISIHQIRLSTYYPQKLNHSQDKN